MLPGIATISSGRIRKARLTIGPKAKGVFPFFPRAAIACYAWLGTTLTRIMTDNNSCYRSKAFAEARRTLDIRRVKTRPDNAKTTGMAGRFIEAALREWHRPYAYLAFERRAVERPIWPYQYKWHLPYGGLNSKPSIRRVGLNRHNLLRLHS
ncbi:transposase family protein [Rhizobium sp. S-51]|uniref:Transposase family protein n=1 Tax=Rhizobium terricola TaxID=2728849 RepID=A0A7Y0B0A6_9HYPH|nr:hypothetical protein [Rhizobium terricola]NML76791.1 transposase family protein [Rhizobium terricola]